MSFLCALQSCPPRPTENFCTAEGDDGKIKRFCFACRVLVLFVLHCRCRTRSSLFRQQRVVATVVMLTSMVGTFVAAMALKSAFLTFICSIIQYLALIWYSLSYIPYARDIVIRFFGYCWNSSKRSLDEPI